MTRRLISEGVAVVLVGRRPQPLREVAAPIGDQALIVPADAASGADMARVVESARQRFGGVDTLVANAGGQGSGTASQIGDKAWADSLTTCPVSAHAWPGP